MGAPTPQTIQFLFTGVHNEFGQVLGAITNFYTKFADLMPSSRSGEVYFWTDLIPQMRLWFGDRVAQNIAARAYLLANNDYEITLEIPRNRIDDDAANVFKDLGKRMATSAGNWPDQLMTNALKNGDTTALLAYDGLPFYSSSHLVNMDDPTSGTQSNLFTTAGSGATLLTSANVALVRAALRGWLGANAQPIGVVPDLIQVPTSLEMAAKQINSAAFTAPAAVVGQNAGGVMQSNVLEGLADTFVNPYLTNSQQWYMHDTKTIGAMLKAFIFQLRQKQTYVMRIAATDPSVWDRKKYLHGVDARGNAGCTFPFLSAKCGP